MLRTIVPLAALLCSCSSSTPNDGGAPPETLYLWVGADKDTFLTCSLSVGCDNGGLNQPFAGELQIANEDGLEQKRAYVHFTLPTLPPDAVVEHARLELYNGAMMGDGRSDELCVPVAALDEPWNPRAMTWQNQPLESAVGGEFSMSMRSKAWAVADVTVAVRKHLADPESNFGFALYIPPNVQADKGFSSINAVSRTLDDLGLAPRLMIEVNSETGGVIRYPETIVEDTDLGFERQSVVMVKAFAGEDWPADWNVTLDEERCL